MREGWFLMRYDAFISYSHAADSQLAPRLQEGLQRMARPWWRRRALHVFRDNTGLTANPGLWTSIATSMDEAEWFVFLASPEAAASPWVQREIEHWLEHRDVDHLMPVVTDGEWVWDDETNDFDRERSTAVPAALYGAFREEPRHIDMRWAHTESQLDLRHPHFRDDVAAVAAPMHGLAKDELVGEDVRQHRRTMRWAWGAAAPLVVLTLGSALATVLAVRNADAADTATAEAQANATEADQQKALADANAAEAAAKAQEALENSQEADANAAEAQSQQQLAEQNAAEASQQRTAAENSALEAQVQAAEAARQAQAALDARDAESAAKADAQLQAQNALRSEATAVSEKENALQQERIAQYQRAAALFAAAGETLAKEDAQAAQQRAESAQQSAETQALAAASAAESGQNPTLSLLLAIEANRLGTTPPPPSTVASSSFQALAGSDSAVGRRALFEAVTAAQGGAQAFAVSRFISMPSDVDDPPAFLWRPALSPDGRWLAAAEFPDPLRGTRGPFAARIFVWDLDTPGTPMKVLAGHTSIVPTVAFAAGGTLVTQDLGATPGDPVTTRIWDVETGTATHERYGIPYIAPGGGVVAVQAWDRLSVEFFDARTRTTTAIQDGRLALDPYSSLGPHGAEPVPWIERPFSGDGRLAVGESDGVAVLWDLTTGGRVTIPLITPGALYSEAPSIAPSGEIATALVDGTYLSFFRTSDGEELSSFPIASMTEYPLNTVWSPDGSRFGVLVYDLVTGETRVVVAVSGVGSWTAPSPICDYGLALWGRCEVGFTTNGSHLTLEIPSGPYGLAFETAVADSDTGTLLRILDGQLLAAGGPGGALLFAQHFDDEGRPHLFIDDTESGRTVFADDDAVTVLDVATDAARFSVTTDDGVVRAWDLVSGHGPVAAARSGTLVLGLAFDPNSNALYGVGVGSSLTQWDPSRVGAAERIGVADTRAALLDDGVTVAEPDSTGHAIVLRDLVTGATRAGATLGPDDEIEYLLTRTTQGPLVANLLDDTSVVTSPSGQVLGRLPAQVRDISRDGTRIAIRHADTRRAEVYATNDLATPIRTFDLNELPDDDLPGLIDAIVLDTDGRRLAATNATGAVVVWDVATGAVLTKKDGTPGDQRAYPLFGLSFSPAGDRLVLKSPSNLVRMWSTSTWSELANQQISPKETAGRVVFSTDGALVAVDGLYLFDGATLDPITRFVSGTGIGTKFSADGRSMLSVTDDGIVLRWAIGVDELVESACRIAGRNLTRTEWSRYKLDPYRATCPAYPLDG